MKENMRLGDLLLEQQVITPEQLDEALQQQKGLCLPLGETLLRLDYVSEDRLLDVLSAHLDVDFFNIAENDYTIVDTSLSNILPVEMCRRLKVLPLFYLADDDTSELTLAMIDPLDDATITEVEQLSDCHVTPLLTTASALDGGIEKMYSDDGAAECLLATFNIDELDRASSIVNKMISFAVDNAASDIHLEPHEKQVHVRMRLDGELNVITTVPCAHFSSVVSRLKVMGSEQKSLMKIEEKRTPQDGSFSRVVSGRPVDFRVSTFPTIHGEKVVIRVLDKEQASAIKSVFDLKMSARTEKDFLHNINQASGIIIVTGPTGSGKSTSLYAAVNEINRAGINIVTVEDPVEFKAGDYVNQSSLLPQAGFTYPRALRAILRQDPDVILIGEVRDLETAEISIQAALTGHLVLTTMHTDDAASAVVRLVDLGIDQFLVSSTVVSAVNQRLLRKVCKHCAREYVPSKAELKDLGIDRDVARGILEDLKRFAIKQAVGCSRCRNTGYAGRQGVFELLTVKPAIKRLILNKETSDVIAAKAREIEQMNMLFEEGLRMALTGITTFDELRKIPRGDYDLKSLDRIFSDAELREYH